MNNRKEMTCLDCHHHCQVDGKDACTNIRQRPGKPAYKFLRALKPCEDFWRAKSV